VTGPASAPGDNSSKCLASTRLPAPRMPLFTEEIGAGVQDHASLRLHMIYSDWEGTLTAARVASIARTLSTSWV
jgi:hypothetical protein